MNFYDRSKPVEFTLQEKILMKSGWIGILFAVLFYFSPQIHPAFLPLKETGKISFGIFEIEFMLFLATVIFLSNVFNLIFFGITVWKRAFLIQHGDKTKAKIINIETKKQYNDQPTKIVLQVGSNEITFESGKIVFNQKKALTPLIEDLFQGKKIGDEIDIIINPDDPSDYIFG